MSVSWMLRVFSGTDLCDGPIRRALPNVVCLSVISKPQQRKGLGPLGLNLVNNQLDAQFLCIVKLVIYKICTKMHGQQNIKSR
jgi:hypothetical protein